jgi:hypothetical protein
MTSLFIRTSVLFPPGPEFAFPNKKGWTPMAEGAQPREGTGDICQNTGNSGTAGLQNAVPMGTGVPSQHLFPDCSGFFRLIQEKTGDFFIASNHAPKRGGGSRGTNIRGPRSRRGTAPPR